MSAEPHVPTMVPDSRIDAAAVTARTLPMLQALDAVMAEDAQGLARVLRVAEAQRPGATAALVASLAAEASQLRALAERAEAAVARLHRTSGEPYPACACGPANTSADGPEALNATEQGPNSTAAEHAPPRSSDPASRSRDRVSSSTLNDALRCRGEGGRVVVSAGVAALSRRSRTAVLQAVADFAAFDAGNDPYGEHDFGAVTVGGTVYFWKIDAYDLDLIGHSPDPADPAVTARVLTVMLAEEY